MRYYYITFKKGNSTGYTTHKLEFEKNKGDFTDDELLKQGVIKLNLPELIHDIQVTKIDEDIFNQTNDEISKLNNKTQTKN